MSASFQHSDSVALEISETGKIYTIHFPFIASVLKLLRTPVEFFKVIYKYWEIG